MRPLLRERWPLLAGGTCAALVLLIFALSAASGRAPDWDPRPLGITIHGWDMATLSLAVALALQLALLARISLQR